MKLLTINTHSLAEENYERKLDIFVDAICRIRPDIIAMQEVNQTDCAPIVALGERFDMRSDNHAYRVVKALYDMGLEYSFIWQGIKKAYGKYQEGVAVMSRLPISDTDTFIMSKATDKENWRCRCALGVKVENEWFYSVHFGRYDDTQDPFSGQWSRFCENVTDKGNIWVMGDFNCNAYSDGYTEVIKSGWYDTFKLAESRDGGVTVRGAIDGWRDGAAEDMRIDYIFSKQRVKVKSSKVVFNGVYEDVVSDHYGVEVVV